MSSVKQKTDSDGDYREVVFLTETLSHARSLWNEEIVVSAIGSWLGSYMAERDEASAVRFLEFFTSGVMTARVGNLEMQADVARDANQVC